MRGESRRVGSAAVVRADDAGGAGRGGAGAGAVCRRRRLRSDWLEELRAVGQHGWSRLPRVEHPCRGSEFRLDLDDLDGDTVTLRIMRKDWPPSSAVADMKNFVRVF